MMKTRLLIPLLHTYNFTILFCVLVGAHMLPLLRESRYSMDIAGFSWEKEGVKINENWTTTDSKYFLFACGRHTRRMLKRIDCAYNYFVGVWHKYFEY